MNTESLSQLGFTPAEIKVYIALLELGTSSAGPILHRTGLQNSVVHLTLNRLLEKGFVSVVQEGKRRHYQATNPNHLLEFIEEKKKGFQQLLPELLLKQQTAKEKPEVTTFRGIKGIKELLQELLEAGSTEHHTFGSTRESLMLGEAWWIEYHKNRAKKGIRAKLLFNQSLSSWTAEHKYPKAEVRYTHTGFEPRTETIIRNNKIGIIIWTEKPIGILICNKSAAESYDKFFEVLWKNS